VKGAREDRERRKKRGRERGQGGEAGDRLTMSVSRQGKIGRKNSADVTAEEGVRLRGGNKVRRGWRIERVVLRVSCTGRVTVRVPSSFSLSVAVARTRESIGRGGVVVVSAEGEKDGGQGIPDPGFADSSLLHLTSEVQPSIEQGLSAEESEGSAG
jgi:hypothetical protein